MKDFFYGLLSLVIITYVISILTEDIHYEIPKEVNGIVISKNTDGIFGNRFIVLLPDTTIKTIHCYDILYETIEVGDTIKTNQP